MPVTSSDIVLYASQNMPEDDTSVAGGAINSGIRVTFTDIAATDRIEALSSNNADSGVLTVVGRNSAGSLISENITLSGTTLVSGNLSFERVLKVDYDTVASGDITLRDLSTDTTIGKVYANESGFRRVFYNATAEPAGGNNKTLYEKVFVKNNNASSALLSAQIQESGVGLYQKIDFALSTAQNDSESVSNRKTAPTNVGSYTNGPTGVIGTDLAPLSGQGVWLRLQLNAGDAAQNSFYTLVVDGSTV